MYLFIIREPTLATAGLAIGMYQRQERRGEGKNKKKGSRQKGKPSTPTQAIDIRMGEEQKKETGSGLPTHLP